MDAHAQRKVSEFGGGCCFLDGGLRIECNPDAETELAGVLDGAGRIGTRFEVEADTVGPRSLQRGELSLRFLHHEVTADHALALVDQRRNRSQNDRADRDFLDEVSITDVEVEDSCPCFEQGEQLGSQLREVCGVDRRCNLDAAKPSFPKRSHFHCSPTAKLGRWAWGAR